MYLEGSEKKLCNKILDFIVPIAKFHTRTMVITIFLKRILVFYISIRFYFVLFLNLFDFVATIDNDDERKNKGK